MKSDAIKKVLSPNDTGETGGHQAGILIPKDKQILSFFPRLNSTLKNPRTSLDFLDETGKEWTFSFIYYNNKYFGGTRNEYRITGMTAFFREFNLKAGDSIILKRLSPHVLRICYDRRKKLGSVIKLSCMWKVIDDDL
jgi:hypothetical protein